MKRAGSDRPVGRTYPVKWVAVALAVTALVLVGGPYLFLDVFLGSAPAKLRLPSVASAASGVVTPGPVSGPWTISTGSQVGYRVGEYLFGQAHTAVGRTSAVSGEMVISGSTVTAASFSVDMATVKSDQGARDAQFRGYIMETYKYPHSSFSLADPLSIGPLPALGHIISTTATGALTMRGVTRTVTFTLHAERVAGGIDVSAAIPITFSLWKIPSPNFAVARVGSAGTLELLLHFVRSNAEGQPLQPVKQAPTSTTVYVPGTF